MSDTRPNPESSFAALYRRAFAEYAAQALWNKRMLEEPTPEDALVVARALRIEGGREARPPFSGFLPRTVTRKATLPTPRH